jgi:bifunctional DNase/RNase
LKIDQRQEPGYETVKIGYVGFVDPYAIEGVVLLKADDGREFHMRAFSGEVARHINSFLDSSEGVLEEEAFPTIYRMLEEICEHNELMLVKVKVYDSGQVLRANLYFTGKKDLVLRNYRASDALALAAFYNVPILVKKNLLKEEMEV